MNSIGENLRALREAEAIAAAADSEIMVQAKRYLRDHIAVANKQASDIEAFYNKTVVAFLKNIEGTPAMNHPEVARLAWDLKTIGSIPHQIRMAIAMAERITFEELIRCGRNMWRAVCASHIARFKCGGDVVKTAIGKMGEVNLYIERIVSEARASGKLPHVEEVQVPPKKQSGAPTVDSRIRHFD